MKSYMLVVIFGMLMMLSNAVQAHRLSSDSILERQSVALKLSPTKTTFSGETTLKLSFLRNTQLVSYHARTLTINSVVLTHKGNAFALDVASPDEFDIVTHQLPESIKGPAELKIQFEGIFSEQVAGLFLKKANQGTAYIMSQFQEMEARRVFPSFDAPDKKTVFEFSVDIPKNLEALHNTRVVSTLIQGERKLIRFAPSKKIYTDVLVLAVGEFNAELLESTQYSSTVYSPKGQLVSVPNDMAELVNNAVRYMSDYLQYPLPYDKLDFLVAPIEDLAGMENVGLIAINNDQIPRLGASSDDICKFRKLIAHEVVHMWFGNDITMAWYNDYWMNESFAEFFAAKVIQNFYPDSMQCTYTPQSSAFFDDNHNARALRASVKHRGDNEAVGQLAYTKGSAILAMAEQAIGELKFKKYMRSYVKQVAGANTSLQQLTQHFTSERYFAPFMHSFVEQSSYPLISLTKEGEQLVIHQNSFFEGTDKKWTIPITIKIWDDKKLTTQSLVLDHQSQSLKNVPHTAQLFIDKLGIGYFRYIDKTGNGFFPIHLLTDAEKAAHMNNQSALAKASKLDHMAYIDELIDIVNTLPHDSAQVSSALATIQDSFVELIPDSLSKQYIRYLTSKLPKIIDWDKILEMNNGSIWLELYGVYLHSNTAITAAKQAFSNTELTHLNNRLAVLRVVVANADKPSYQSLLDRFKHSENHLKEDLLNALGYVNSQQQVNDFYEWLLSDVTQGHKIDYRFQYPAFMPKHRAFVASYIKQNKAKISKRIADDKLQWFPYNFITACSAQEAELVKRTFSDWQDIQGLQDKLAVVLEKINGCDVNAKHSLKSVRARLGIAH
ncbi:hypothetical protein PSECIP111854_00637 [Pseudoalteromonas sp. CIP111854]|uniref:Aminopeptidase N n=1 Tax=Pseudoalteromonas holothuriae TaxID=2963714 RepID=A0A9W4QS79_9GAMM|nr:M1 family metallopeptidase [Pseudoalteromonas sp. CIP111854]CAH9050953.1 hypothetical protein PSECIP111854_00637 [Pseudoalteromonas sp. CIP111854]